MKVKEVIIDLQRLDPELEVVIGAESTYFSPTKGVFTDDWYGEKVAVIALWSAAVKENQFERR